MSFFATEIPIVPGISKEKFAAQAIAWVKGMNHSSLFDGNSDAERFSDHASLMSETGEMLTMKYCDVYHGFVIGVRHEYPAPDGLIWRSEIVLTEKDGRAMLRVKGQCLSSQEGAKVQVPKKPYFVKMVIDDGWVSKDQGILPSHEPINATDLGADHVARLLLGKTNTLFPIVYISNPFPSAHQFDSRSISKLAFRLGGVAHVIVEPSRDFSVELMEATNNQNPYGGTISLSVSGSGIISRLFIGGKLQTDFNIFNAIEKKVVQISSSREARFGWDWQDLLEESSRQLRVKVEEGHSSHDEYEKIASQAVSEAKQEIARLRKQVEDLSQKEIQAEGHGDGELVSGGLVEKIGKELYEGEFSDRIRSVLLDVEGASVVDLDERTKEVVRRFVEFTKFTGGAKNLEQRIKSAGKNSGKADHLFQQILVSLGYDVRKDGGHPVCTPPDSLFGLSAETLSTSPSDHRAGKNKASQLINGMKLKRLS